MIQGILEWLPVSSEGMLVIYATHVGLQEDVALRVALWMHLGTMLAVLATYPDEFKRMLFTWDEHVPERKFLIISTIGTALLGIPVRFFLLDIISGTTVGILYLIIGFALLLTSLVISYSRTRLHGTKNIGDMPDWQSFLVGLGQGLAIIPGISRSGTTVSILLAEGVSNEESFRGSFLMSVMASLGAVILELGDIATGDAGEFIAISTWYLVLAIVFAAVIGYLTINGLILLARKINFSWFTSIFGVIMIGLGLLNILG